MRSLLVTSASRRPLYCSALWVVGLTVLYWARSATVPKGLPGVPQPVPRPPQPGLLSLVQPRSCLPEPTVKGVPILIPWPTIVAQFTPSMRPAVPQLALGLMVPTTALPGNERYCAAILPAGARASNAAVSYQPVPVRDALGSRTVS